MVNVIKITSHSQEAVLQNKQSINWGGGPDIKVKIHIPNFYFHNY